MALNGADRLNAALFRAIERGYVILLESASQMNVLARLNSFLLYPFARVIVGAQSELQRFKTMNQKQKILIETPYAGQPIMLLALYQKGRLRPDLIRLLQAARQQGIYVLGVNTLKIKAPQELEGLMDCYIERPNFGRDFGSYKTGFLHVFDRNWEKTCPRLLMLNDSVYYSTRGLDKFLTDMITSETEVLGATENYEIEYHLGSFTIAMAQSVLQAERFRKYWRAYKLTDVRPLVIIRGEMRLSKTLKRCVSMMSQFKALYSSDRFLNEVKSSHALQDLVIKDSRTGSSTPAPRFSAEAVVKLLSGRFIARRYSLESKVEVAIDAPLKELNEEILITGRDDFARYLLRNTDATSDTFDEILNESLAAVASETFMLGSQIHQNAAVLLEIGLPIIKLDGLYRGMFNNYDIMRLQKKLTETEARELSALLMDRPYGGQMLVGWKRSAFMKGLI
ncbi:MAG: rhamnan synthesis F family protein [Paracoccaceae bacterium]